MLQSAAYFPLFSLVNVKSLPRGYYAYRAFLDAKFRYKNALENRWSTNTTQGNDTCIKNTTFRLSCPNVKLKWRRHTITPINRISNCGSDSKILICSLLTTTKTHAAALENEHEHTTDKQQHVRSGLGIQYKNASSAGLEGSLHRFRLVSVGKFNLPCNISHSTHFIFSTQNLRKVLCLHFLRV